MRNGECGMKDRIQKPIRAPSCGMRHHAACTNIETPAMRSLPFRIPQPAFCILLALALVSDGRGDEKNPTADDELKVKNAFGSTDGASLVAFLATRARGQV